MLLSNPIALPNQLLHYPPWHSLILHPVTIWISVNNIINFHSFTMLFVLSILNYKKSLAKKNICIKGNNIKSNERSNYFREKNQYCKHIIILAQRNYIICRFIEFNLKGLKKISLLQVLMYILQ